MGAPHLSFLVHVEMRHQILSKACYVILLLINNPNTHTYTGLDVTMEKQQVNRRSIAEMRCLRG